MRTTISDAKAPCPLDRVKPAAENMDDLEKTVNRLDAAASEAFRKLANAEQLKHKNINRAFLEFQFQ